MAEAHDIAGTPASPIAPEATATQRDQRHPVLHALSAYVAAIVVGWAAIGVDSAFPLLDLPWSGPFIVGEAVALAGVLGLVGWAFTRAGYTWLWAGAIGLICGLVGPNFQIAPALLDVPAVWLQGLAPALATLILYRGRSRVTGIVLLSILIGVYIATYVLILVALSNWHYVF